MFVVLPICDLLKWNFVSIPIKECQFYWSTVSGNKKKEEKTFYRNRHNHLERFHSSQIDGNITYAQKKADWIPFLCLSFHATLTEQIKKNVLIKQNLYHWMWNAQTAWQRTWHLSIFYVSVNIVQLVHCESHASM